MKLPSIVVVGRICCFSLDAVNTFGSMKALITIPLILSLLCLSLTLSHAQLRLLKADKLVVQLDGLIDSKEWSPAEKIVLEGEYRLYLMADSAWLYLAAFGAQQTFPYTDVFFKTATGQINLHASMQLGERALPEDELWDDEKPAWKWGNNQDWSANTVRYKAGASQDQPFHQQIESYQGQEFRISRDKPGSDFAILVVIRDFVDPAVHASYPIYGSVHNFTTWMGISLQG